MSTKSITAVFLIAGLLFFFVLGFVVGAIEEHRAIIDFGPYSIVPDPSKPKETGISEYDEDRHNLCVDDLPVLKFIEKYYMRKP